jgi:hypothetical protein
MSKVFFGINQNFGIRKNFYDNESELILNSYCLTSSKVENSLLVISNIMNKK